MVTIPFNGLLPFKAGSLVAYSVYKLLSCTIVKFWLTDNLSAASPKHN